jgi:putative hydrolase of the HAD superfamily
VSGGLPDPASVRTLLLDAGGVLVRPSFVRVAQALRGRGIEASAEALAAAEAHAKRELDLPPSPGLERDEQRGWHYFNLVLARAGIARCVATEGALAELKAWHDVHNAWEDVPDGVPEALDRLRASGRTLVVVSNANGTVVTLLRRLGLLDRFAAVLDSAVEGVEKPDPRLFRMALERACADPRTTLHVGDMYHVDVVGARAAGLRAVLVDSDGLYPDADCPRVPSLLALAEHLCPAGGGL